MKAICPVTGAFQYIRPEVLERVGLYDPGFRMACEDVDYDLRVFQAGFECVYEPAVRPCTTSRSSAGGRARS